MYNRVVYLGTEDGVEVGGRAEGQTIRYIYIYIFIYIYIYICMYIFTCLFRSFTHTPLHRCNEYTTSRS